MADVKDFELFHGIVLTKLVRADRPVTLRMIETNPSKAWAAYKINDAVIIYAKYRTNPRRSTRHKGSYTWSFPFANDELRVLSQLQDDAQVYLTLICARQKIRGRNASMYTCLIEPADIEELIDLSSTTSQCISVKYIPRCSFRVRGSMIPRELLIHRNDLDQWQVPGS